MLMAFTGILAAWVAAVVATAYPLGGLSLFVPGILTFMLAAYLAQCLTLECLTGVLEVRESKVLMGVSETAGCFFAALGGYLGDELEVYGASAPFALQASVAFVTLSILAAALGHRLVTHAAPESPGGEHGGWIRQSLSGLCSLPVHSQSFVSGERDFQRRNSRLSEPFLAAAEAHGDAC